MRSLIQKGQRVRSGAEGATYGLVGVITEVSDKVRIRWEGNVLYSAYQMDSEVVQCLQDAAVNSPKKMEEVRRRYGLPELGTAHDCQAQQPGPGDRAQHLSRPHPCYEGQWTIHGQHDYEVRVQNWLGGGKATVHCPGKTADTVLR
jgi:hypothetical protein